MNKLTLCLDFDGVLHSYASGWKGIGVIPDGPVDGAVEACRLYVEHFRVVVFSSRCSEQAGIDAIRKWLEDWGFPVDSMEVVSEKPPAHLTLDDRAWTFRGIFPSLESIMGFVPWNKL